MENDHDMTGRSVVVTGATSGIGAATARALANRGARLTLVGRSEAALTTMASTFGNDTGAVVADLSSLSATRRAAASIRDHNDEISVLINNAGGVFASRRESLEGFELNLALNHLSPFVLTSELVPALEAAAARDPEFGARIVNVASASHRVGVNWDDLQFHREYSLTAAYGQSKALMIMATQVWADRLEGTGVTANSLHPGVVRTKILNKSGNRLLSGLFRLVGRFVLATPEQGATQVLRLAASRELDGVTGAYWNEDKIDQPDAKIQNPSDRQRAWELTEQLVASA